MEFLLAAIIDRAFVSFSTTDGLSGIDHYEIAVIDRTEPPLESSVFIEAQSPYQLPKAISGNLRVTVRAIDKAQNIRDESVDVNFPESIFSKLKNNITTVFLIISVFALFISLITPILSRYKTKRFKKEEIAAKDQNITKI